MTTTIKIVEEKAANPKQMKESDLATGKYYRVGNNTDCDIYRRAEVENCEEEFFFTSSSDDHALVYSGDGDYRVYPCNPDGTPIEPAVVEKVSRSKIKYNEYYEVGGELYEKTRAAFGKSCKWMRDGTFLSHSNSILVTPVTLTKIVYRKGVE